MVKKYIKLIILLLTLTLASGCMTAGKWVFYLPNEYVIATTPHGTSIRTKRFYTHSSMISNNNYVIMPGYRQKIFAANGKYTGVVLISYPASEPISLECISSKYYWYIVKEESLEILGPFSSKEEFNDAAACYGMYYLQPIKEHRNSTAIGRHIKEYCYNDRYVGVRMIDPEERTEEKEKYHLEEWYIINCEYDTIYGPFKTIQEYESALEELGITDFCEWISTDKKPKGGTSWWY